MLVFAAIGVFGAGMLAIAAGIPIRDFGYGNTLILSGVMAWCTSAIMATLWACFRDLKTAVQQPEQRRPREAREVDARAVAPEVPAVPAHPVGTTGWPETIPERAPAAPPPPSPAPVAPEPRDQRRNILFSSTKRPRDNPRPSEAAAATNAPAATAELRPSLPPAPPADEPRPPMPRREPPPARTIRPISTVGPRDPVSAPPLPPAPSSPVPPPAPPPPVPAAEPATAAASTAQAERPARDGDPNVTVLKSGVVDGMAYWLFSDGSIEAQMPEGMMRFTSIDELRAHLDKRS